MRNKSKHRYTVGTKIHFYARNSENTVTTNNINTAMFCIDQLVYIFSVIVIAIRVNVFEKQHFNIQCKWYVKHNYTCMYKTNINGSGKKNTSCIELIWKCVCIGILTPFWLFTRCEGTFRNEFSITMIYFASFKIVYIIKSEFHAFARTSSLSLAFSKPFCCIACYFVIFASFFSSI